MDSSPPVRAKRSFACLGSSFSREIVRPGIVLFDGSRAGVKETKGPLGRSAAMIEMQCNCFYCCLLKNENKRTTVQL